MKLCVSEVSQRLRNLEQISWLAIGNSGSYFNTHRMAKEYIELAYKFKYEEIKEKVLY
jgi:hypothetical protein